MNVFIDIDIFKSDLIDINIDIFKTYRYIDNRYGLSIYRTPLSRSKLRCKHCLEFNTMGGKWEDETWLEVEEDSEGSENGKMGGKEYSGRGDCGCLSSSYPLVK